MKKEMSIQSYFDKHELHAELLQKLRNIVINYPFEETIKWGMPTYVLDHKNLMGIGAFKNHVAVWFFQGALLADTQKLLLNVQEGKTKSMRQIHYQKTDDVSETALKMYIEQTIENHKKGIRIKVDRKSKVVELPEILIQSLEQDKRLSDHFARLSHGAQREYAEYICSAKKEKTKSGRLNKIIPMISMNKGLNDKYKKC
jgi:uncharacterized protein YdeI (YjbR/CyaY-like superfamily)